jgi:ABC-type uncharacterized transport system involved in gliding motility auxiliary subunit
MTDIRTSNRITLGLAVVVGAGILVLVNWLGARHYRRMDWTSAGLYSLSEKSLKVLKELKKPVTATVFMTEGSATFAETQEILKRYRAASPLLSVETLDPTRNRARAEALVKEFGVSRPSVVFKCEDRKKFVTEDQLAEMDFSRARLGGEPTVKAFKGEQEFTSAILSVTQSRTPKVVFTTGHGERQSAARSRDSVERVAEMLRQDNCKVDDWSSLGSASVPEGTDLVVVAGPRTAFTEPEREALSRFLDAGGRAVLMLDAEFAPGPGAALADTGLKPLLEARGVVLDDDVVVDPKSALPMMGPETIFTRTFRAHPVTRLLQGQGLAVVFPLARSVRAAEKPPQGVTVTTLVETSADGWGETNLKNLETKVEKDDKDIKGPVSLAVAVEAAGTGEKKLRMIVVGDVDFASNGGVANAANLYFVTSIVNWLLERDALISIPPKSTDQVAVTLARGDIAQITLFVLAVLPLAGVGLGLAVWLKRRS